MDFCSQEEAILQAVLGNLKIYKDSSYTSIYYLLELFSFYLLFDRA